MKRCGLQTPGTQSLWYAHAQELPAGWNDGLSHSHFLTAASLQMHEAISLPDVTHGYAALLAPGGRIIARAAFQVLSLRSIHLRREALPGWQWRIWSGVVQTMYPKLLVAGHLFRHDIATMQYDDVALSAFDAFTWYRNVTQLAMKRCSAQAVLLKEPPQELVPLLMHHAPEHLLLRNDSSMQMRIPPEWESLKDYEKSLKHKYAQRLRKVRQPWALLHAHELNEAEVRSSSARIFELYEQVASHQQVRVGILNETFIPLLKNFYGADLKVWGIWEDDVMIAFASAWVHDGRFDMFYIGFDYARNAALQLYFNILFFAVEQAILHKAPLLILGRTALEAKARVGCRPVYLNTFLHVRNPLLRGIVARLQARFSEEGGEWEQRHPFKVLGNDEG